MILQETPGRTYLISILFLFLFMIVYSSSVFVPYAFSDSYAALYAAMRHHASNEAGLQVASGRPLNALLYAWVFTPMRGIGDLRYLRAGGVHRDHSLRCRLIPGASAYRSAPTADFRTPLADRTC